MTAPVLEGGHFAYMPDCGIEAHGYIAAAHSLQHIQEKFPPHLGIVVIIEKSVVHIIAS